MKLPVPFFSINPLLFLHSPPGATAKQNCGKKALLPVKRDKKGISLRFLRPLRVSGKKCGKIGVCRIGASAHLIGIGSILQQYKRDRVLQYNKTHTALYQTFKGNNS